MWKNYHLIGISLKNYTITNHGGSYFKECSSIKEGLSNYNTYCNHVQPTWQCSSMMSEIVDSQCNLVGTNLTGLKCEAANQFQPVKQLAYHCTLIMLENLALPEWLSVNCTHLMLNTVLCSSHSSISLAVSNGSTMTFSEIDHNLICRKNEVKHRHKCISVNNVSFGQTVKLCAGPDIKAKQFHIFLKIFNKDTHLPTIFVSKNDKNQCQEVSIILTEYINFALKLIHKPCTDCQGLMFCEQGLFRFFGPSMAYIFACSSSEMISETQVCNGHNDCLSEDDELMCNCTNSESNNTRFCIVSKMFSEFGPNLSAVVFVKVQKNPHAEEVFVCKHGATTPGKYVNDGYPDCPDNDDERITKTSMKNNLLAKNLCKNPLHIQCYEGFDRCFPFEKLCLHEVDSLGKSMTCRNGYHLTHCKSFQCSHAFKCPQAYCIPYKYLCNGQRECINGEDELNCETFTKRCVGLFKCANSSICIHATEVCDEKHDCVLGHDEIICVPAEARCPLHCSCFLLAASCSGDKGVEYYPHKKTLLNYCIYLSFQNTQAKKAHLKIFQHAITITILHSDLKMFCTIVDLTLPNLKFVKFENSTMAFLANHCLRGMRNIVKLVFNCLQLKELGMLSFQDQQKLEYLDLSRNLLTELRGTTLSHLHSLKYLNIQRNKLGKFSFHLFQGLNKLSKIQTDYFAICCAVKTESKTTCTAKVEWPFSCNDILTKPMTISLWHFVIFVLCLNLVSLVFIALRLAFFTKGTGYDVTVIFVNICGILCGIYLVVVLSASIHYEGKFFTREKHWRGTTLYHSAANIFSTFSIISPSILYFETYSRYLVVKYPFETGYKKASRACIVWSAVLSGGLCVSIMMWLSQRFLEQFNVLETPLCTVIGSVLDSIVVDVFTGLTIPFFISICLGTTCTNIFLFIEIRESRN